MFTLNRSVGGRSILVDAHDERRPIQRAGRRWLEREQPVVFGGSGVWPRRERDNVVRRGFNEHLVHVGHVLLAGPVERERGRLVMVMVVRVSNRNVVAAPRVMVVVVVVVVMVRLRRMI